MVPFNRVAMTDREYRAIREAMASGRLSGGGDLTKRAEQMIELLLGAPKVILTSSGTRALEMSASLIGLAPGDEVIMPSFTFVGTATAFLLHGGTPVYADISAETLNIEVDTIASLVSDRTKVVVPVHYNGVARHLNELRSFCDRRGLYMVEDAAHGFLAEESGRPLGTFGHFAAFSFHDTKTFTCGEGGALVVNDTAFIGPAEVFSDKGTNRTAFRRGERAFYSWVGPGSSISPGEIPAAILMAQIERRDEIIGRRRKLFQRYLELLDSLVRHGAFTIFQIPSGCMVNYGMCIIMVNTPTERSAILEYLNELGIEATFHYVPLHQSEFGRRFAKGARLPVTEDVAARIIRLPMSDFMTEADQEQIAEHIGSFYRAARRRTSIGNMRAPVR
jgi:dTDP-4-amino-4,6-dideoxygalactose transaminase